MCLVFSFNLFFGRRVCAIVVVVVVGFTSSLFGSRYRVSNRYGTGISIHVCVCYCVYSRPDEVVKFRLVCVCVYVCVYMQGTLFGSAASIWIYTDKCICFVN